MTHPRFMSTKPIIIATTASVALIAAAGAGATVVARMWPTPGRTSRNWTRAHRTPGRTSHATGREHTDTVPSPQDDRTTVWARRSPTTTMTTTTMTSPVTMKPRRLKPLPEHRLQRRADPEDPGNTSKSS